MPAEVLDDLALVASEVLTNCVEHSGRASEPVEVAIRVWPGVVRLEVRDGGPGFEPVPLRAPSPLPAPGWGLFLVDRLASRWGNEPGGTVWAELDYPALGRSEG